MSDEKELKYKIKYRLHVNDKYRYCSALCSSYDDVIAHANDMIRMYGKDFEMIYLKEILELAPFFINDFYKNKIEEHNDSHAVYSDSLDEEDILPF